MSPSRNLFHVGNGSAVDVALQQLKAIVGNAQLHPFVFLNETYYNVDAEIVGANPGEVVVVGAHLDSTAANDPNYDAKTCDAPGADDDLSGVLGVLEVARLIRALEAAAKAPPARSIRLVLFNGEEYWMRGSWAYAHALKESEGKGGPAVVAMLAMDMIGWHREQPAPFVFEIHGAGTANSEYNRVSAGSLQLGAIVAEAAATLAPNLLPQVYPLQGCATDPGTDRSDHSSFHYHDWPACLVSEDLWIDVCATSNMKPGQSGNRNYHTAKDLFESLDPDYIADITRTVAATAWMIANA